MTETIDLEALQQTLEECEKAKAYCRKLISRQNIDTKVIDKQEKEIQRLLNNMDPRRIKTTIDLAARARSNLGMEDIDKHMSKFKEN